MLCVVCKATTEDQTHETVTAHVCPDGHGLWMDPRALLEAVRTDPANAGRANTFDEEDALYTILDHDVIIDDAERACPMDGVVMHSGRYGADGGVNVVIDVCPTHGVWLDAGELDSLEAWAASHFAAGSEDTKAYERRAAAHELHPDGEILTQRLPVMDVVKSWFHR